MYLSLPNFLEISLCCFDELENDDKDDDDDDKDDIDELEEVELEDDK